MTTSISFAKKVALLHWRVEGHENKFVVAMKSHEMNCAWYGMVDAPHAVSSD
jgi:hypothetical protein